MADFEDALSPDLGERRRGPGDAPRRGRAASSSSRRPEGKEYALNDETATLVVRPRGWHLVERHVLVDGEPMSARLFDFGLYFFHNGGDLERAPGERPVLLPAQAGEPPRGAAVERRLPRRRRRRSGIPRGSIRATVLIETIRAAFEMDEILYELREHAAGLNAGRWDYIFSIIKKFRERPGMVLPDRAQVTMAVPFMRAYTQLLVQTATAAARTRSAAWRRSSRTGASRR